MVAYSTPKQAIAKIYVYVFVAYSTPKQAIAKIYVYVL
jgi:hypothetical protein